MRCCMNESAESSAFRRYWYSSIATTVGRSLHTSASSSRMSM